MVIAPPLISAGQIGRCSNCIGGGLAGERERKAKK
jgi:hypothetical protein